MKRDSNRGIMRNKLFKTMQILGIICLLISLSLAEDDSLNFTTAAYPGAPTPATAGSSSSVTVTKSVTSSQSGTVQAGKTVIALGSLARGSGSASRTSSTTSTSTVTAITTNQAPPATQQNVLLPYNVQTSPPTSVYYSGSYMPWSSFTQSYPTSTLGLWVDSNVGWSWYASCPVGGWIQNLMYVPYTGTMKLYEFYPDGSVKLYSYGFATPGYKYIWFYADKAGRHVTLFTIFDKPSNYIAIDVV